MPCVVPHKRCHLRKFKASISISTQEEEIKEKKKTITKKKEKEAGKKNGVQQRTCAGPGSPTTGPSSVMHFWPVVGLSVSPLRHTSENESLQNRGSCAHAHKRQHTCESRAIKSSNLIVEAIGGQLCGVAGGAAQVREPRVWSLHMSQYTSASASNNTPLCGVQQLYSFCFSLMRKGLPHLPLLSGDLFLVAPSTGTDEYLECAAIKVEAAVKVVLRATAHQHLRAAVNEATHASLCASRVSI